MHRRHRRRPHDRPTTVIPSRGGWDTLDQPSLACVRVRASPYGGSGDGPVSPPGCGTGWMGRCVVLSRSSGERR